MNWVIGIVGIVVLLLVGLGVWARVAPSEANVWHVMPEAVTNRDLDGGAMRVVGAGEDGLAQLDTIIRAEPRTSHLAGSVEEGMVTYISRSKVFGFPDYITVRQSGKEIELYSRLRFGQSDLGVNAERLDRWLALYGQR